MNSHPAPDMPSLSPELNKIPEAKHHDPFAVLGKHTESGDAVIRVYIPRAREAHIVENKLPLRRVKQTDLFEWRGDPALTQTYYKVAWLDDHDCWHEQYDPYCFPPQLQDFDLHLFSEGKHWNAYRFLGAKLHEIDDISGVLFAVWAPSAGRVSVACDSAEWDGRRYPMRARGGSGIWELFIPGMRQGEPYKYEIRNRTNGTTHLKTDPFGQHFEVRPSNASLVPEISRHHWNDKAWMEARADWDWQHEPISIYEVHLGSWQRDENGAFLSYSELATRLVNYVTTLGFTHIEILPVTEHPLDDSWGYQTTGYYAPTSRFGTPDDFRQFVDHFHQHGIGVIMDWAPGHFPKDAHALAQFDGSALFEHEDPRRGEHRDWGTLIYNYSRNEVRNFLVSNAVYWLEEFHIDGLRVDAVASMLYLDYSREHGDWLPNEHGGRENLDAIRFLQELNEISHGQYPGSMMIAEESTSWPQVTRPVWAQGLGFSMKWNMGWMHDTLQYFTKDPIHRRHHHNELTFGLLYAFSENFMLPFSHDEVVHGKRSMLHKMPGDEWQQFANLRLLYVYMYTYPGKKLLFMGSEFAQRNEWDCNKPLDWDLLQHKPHQGMKNLIQDLNKLYRCNKSLHQQEFTEQGFEWIDCDAADQSILSFMRQDENGGISIVALNLTPVPRSRYRIGIPCAGSFKEILNSDSSHYGGSNVGNQGEVHSTDTPYMGRAHSLVITLPPLAGIVLSNV